MQSADGRPPPGQERRTRPAAQPAGSDAADVLTYQCEPSVPQLQLAARRRSARRAAWLTWHHLDARGLAGPLVRETLAEIIREAG